MRFYRVFSKLITAVVMFLLFQGLANATMLEDEGSFSEIRINGKNYYSDGGFACEVTFSEKNGSGVRTAIGIVYYKMSESRPDRQKLTGGDIAEILNANSKGREFVKGGPVGGGGWSKTGKSVQWIKMDNSWARPCPGMKAELIDGGYGFKIILND